MNEGIAVIAVIARDRRDRKIGRGILSGMAGEVDCYRTDEGTQKFDTLIGMDATED